MIRFHDWSTRLANYFEEYRDQPFEFGKFDCAMFACGAIHAMTSIRPLEQYIGKYSTEGGATRQMKIFSGGGIRETAKKVCTEIGLFQVVPGLAKRGDMVLIPFENDFSWAVVDLDGRSVRAVCRTGGTDQVPANDITACWSFTQ